MDLTKPKSIFDREAEWADLTGFVTNPQAGATLGVVSGRRRQGKTLLLYELAKATKGLYFGATEATATDSLARLGQAIGDHLGITEAVVLRTWEHAIDALLGLGREQVTTVVIDEFPYLVRSARSLPSVLQHALTPGRSQRTGSRTRLLLCGSALSFMGGLLSGSAPLRGRAGLELPIRPLDYRMAAEFWGIATEPRLAAQVYSIVGGTPAYRREYVNDDAPSSLDDFDSWVVRAVLNPARPLFREARYLLAEDPDLREPALYNSVLAAVADGNATRGGIASYIGRKATDVQHPLTVLEDTGLLMREPDVLRAGRSQYRITEPLLTFYQAVMRPEWTPLEQRRGADVWRRSRARFASNVVGPAFEDLVREWTMRFAAPESLGGVVVEVGRGSLTDPAHKTGYEFDVLAFGQSDSTSRGRPLLAFGEAKWGITIGFDQLKRLEQARGVLNHRADVDASAARLLLASGKGFSRELVQAARIREDIVLVDLDRIYKGR